MYLLHIFAPHNPRVENSPRTLGHVVFSFKGDRDLARKIVPGICVKLDRTITNRTFFKQESLAKSRKKVNCLPGYAMQMGTHKAQRCCGG